MTTLTTVWSTVNKQRGNHNAAGTSHDRGHCSCIVVTTIRSADGSPHFLAFWPPPSVPGHRWSGSAGHAAATAGEHRSTQIQQPPGAKRLNEVAAPMVGEFLLGTEGAWSGASFYKNQWEDCNNVGLPTQTCTAAAGSPSTNKTYQVAAGDVGHTLVFLVTAFSSPGSGTTLGSTASGVVAFGAPLDRLAPVVSGVTQDGQMLSVTSGTWDTGGTNSPPAFGYQWRRCDGAGLNCGKALPGPAGQLAAICPHRRRPRAHPGGLRHRHQHMAGRLRVRLDALTHVTTTVVTPGNTAAPTISGDAQSGKTLTEAHGGWIPKKPASFTYQWQEVRCLRRQLLVDCGRYRTDLCDDQC